MNLLSRSQKNNNSVTSLRTDAWLFWATVAKLALGLILIALLPLAPQALADSFFSTFFSTGDPDGKIGTLSRPPSAGLVETETADDFILSESMVINQATFIGLLPPGAPLTSINNVEVEIYHVFPVDSDAVRTPNVPTRMNSPADDEIDSATRDSSDGSLSFTPTLVSMVFSVQNSVVNGINKSPNQTTNGEGPVTGEMVSITVTFDPPIALPADHYFFRPEVGLSSGNFLWLSAPRPVAPPLFVGDLQSWIRNANLAPDWLRIGTDITLQGPFNASFSLSGETIEQRIEELVPCSGPASGGTWKNHGQYVRTIAHVSQMFVNQGLISGSEKGQIVSDAAQSSCGKKSKKGAKSKKHRRGGHRKHKHGDSPGESGMMGNSMMGNSF
jgi:hypothetical protein